MDGQVGCNLSARMLEEQNQCCDEVSPETPTWLELGQLC
jgi:hypothetical protein